MSLPRHNNDYETASLRGLRNDGSVLEKEAMVSTVGGLLHLLDDFLDGFLGLERFGDRVVVDDFSSGGGPGVGEGGKVILELKERNREWIQSQFGVALSFVQREERDRYNHLRVIPHPDSQPLEERQPRCIGPQAASRVLLEEDVGEELFRIRSIEVVVRLEFRRSFVIFHHGSRCSSGQKSVDPFGLDDPGLGRESVDDARGDLVDFGHDEVSDFDVGIGGCFDTYDVRREMNELQKTKEQRGGRQRRRKLTESSELTRQLLRSLPGDPEEHVDPDDPAYQRTS